MQVIRGVGSPGFTSRYLSLRRLGAAAEPWASYPGRPGRRAAWWRRRAGEEAGRSGSGSRARAGSGGVRCPPVRFRPGRAPGGLFVSGAALGAGAGPWPSCSGNRSARGS